MKKISNTDTKKLENLYKLNKIDELEQETKLCSSRSFILVSKELSKQQPVPI